MGVNASCQPEDSVVAPQTYITTLTMPHYNNLATSTSQAPPPASSRDKKRKLASLATLKKKLVLRRRRSSKSCDHARVIRDLLQDWSIRDIAALSEEYEASAALKDLTVQADLARPPAPTYKQDLSDLFDYKYCTDVDLVFQGAVFPVHRAILSSRCAYFQEILRKYPGHDAHINIDIRTPGIDIPMFSALLRYLYTGEFNPYDGTSKAHNMHLSNMDLLMQLCDEFGRPNALECDLRYLLDSGDYADCILVFSSGENHSGNSESITNSVGGGSIAGESTGGHSSDYGFHNKLECFCHKAILSARSPFFRSLIQRRQRYTEEAAICGNVNAVTSVTRIVLDECVIPKRYAKVLLQAVYLDTLDFNNIMRDSSSINSLSEAQSMAVTGRPRMTVVEEAMEVYQIGRFLELDILTQSCEDLIVENINLENLVSVMQWSKQSYGSAYVQRQALHFLREEFSQVSQSPVLLELDKSTIVQALSSDFLQAAELEVLQAVLRWGEHQLFKRIEEREPNLVSQTAHSVTRKGLRKRDLNDVELREILSELLPHVRMDHVLPPYTHETLNQAIKRGLVSTPPSHMIGGDTANYRVNAWIRSKNNGLFVKPRLFTPYAEEVKTVLDDQQSSTGMSVRLPCYVSHIPDALYMVDQHCPPTDPAQQSTVPIPEPEVVAGMVRRERELTSSPGYQRAAGLLFADRRMLRRRVRLRVVREFNMPDTVAEVLENATYADESHQPPHCHVRDEGRSRLHPTEFLEQTEPEPPLSDVVPDVALASSSLSALQLSGYGSTYRNQVHRSRHHSPTIRPNRTSTSLEALEGTGRDEQQTMALDLVDSSGQYRSTKRHHHRSSRHTPPLTTSTTLLPPPPIRASHFSSPLHHSSTLKPPARAPLIRQYSTLNTRHKSTTYTPPPQSAPPSAGPSTTPPPALFL